MLRVTLRYIQSDDTRLQKNFEVCNTALAQSDRDIKPLPAISQAICGGRHSWSSISTQNDRSLDPLVSTNLLHDADISRDNIDIDLSKDEQCIADGRLASYICRESVLFSVTKESIHCGADDRIPCSMRANSVSGFDTNPFARCHVH